MGSPNISNAVRMHQFFKMKRIQTCLNIQKVPLQLIGYNQHFLLVELGSETRYFGCIYQRCIAIVSACVVQCSGNLTSFEVCGSLIEA